MIIRMHVVLSGAARANESVRRAARHDQIHPVDRAFVAERLRNALKVERRFHQGCPRWMLQ